MSERFKPYGWVRNDRDHAAWQKLKEHFKTLPFARHEPTGMLVQFLRYSESAGAVICRDTDTDEEHILSGLLMTPLSEMEIIAHAAR